MGVFSETSFLDDEEYPIWPRRILYDNTYYNVNVHKSRFSSLDYLNDIFLLNFYKDVRNVSHSEKRYIREKLRPLVYKNIGQRIGVKALKNLMSYLSRDLPHQQEREYVPLFDSNHNVIDEGEVNNFADCFADDFTGQDFENEHRYFINLLNAQKNTNDRNNLKYDIWRIGTTVKRRNNWSQDCTISELHDGDIVRIEYQTPEGQCSDYINRQDVVPTVTPEGFKIYDQAKANKPEQMLIASDDDRYSIHKHMVYKFERNIPKDFHHLMFSIGGNDYNKDNADYAFKSFLDESFSERGFDYIYSFHDDTKNPHYHVIVKDKSSLLKNKRFPKGKADSLTIRRELNKKLFANGIERSVVKKTDMIAEIHQEKSLEEKINQYPQKDSFTKSDIKSYFDDVMDAYYLYATEHNQEALNDFFMFMRKKSRNLLKTKKKDVMDVLNEVIEDSKQVDDKLPQFFMSRLKEKEQSQNVFQIEDNIRRLYKNLKTTERDFDAHPHKLSTNQLFAKGIVQTLMTICQENLKQKDKEKSKDQEQSNDFGR